MDTEKSNK